MKKIFLFISLIFGINSYSQQVTNIDVYILINKCSKVTSREFENDSIYFKDYRLVWNKISALRELKFKINTDGTVTKNITIGSDTNSIYLKHSKIKNDKTVSKIDINQISKDKLIIPFEEFQYYDESLLTMLQKARNLFIINEDDIEKKYHIAKKVELTILNKM